jgi:hypothetical protein
MAGWFDVESRELIRPGFSAPRGAQKPVAIGVPDTRYCHSVLEWRDDR